MNQWKKLRLVCQNEKCTGEWDPKTGNTTPFRMHYLGRRFWAHGFRCPSCARTLWLQSEPWSSSQYDLSPIQDWGFWAYLFVISFLTLPAGIALYHFNGMAGLTLLVLANAGLFTGGIRLVLLGIQEVESGEKSFYDKRLLFPLFSAAVALPFGLAFLDAETLLRWGALGSISIGYLVGSLWESRGW